MSCVRSNRSGSVGFLADWCRTNVAVTRARNGLIVVGNEATLRADRRSWGPFFDWAYAHGVVAGRARCALPIVNLHSQSRERARPSPAPISHALGLRVMVLDGADDALLLLPRAGGPYAEGSEMKLRTRLLATGRKEFLEQQQDMMMTLQQNQRPVKS
eukprot:COSAG01_NODE_22382_length_858_cov_0.847167_1_plen_157_part_10